MGFQDLARYINKYSDNLTKFGPLKVYSLALEVLKKETLVDEFMVTAGGYTLNELRRIKQKRAYYASN